MMCIKISKFIGDIKDCKFIYHAKVIDNCLDNFIVIDCSNDKVYVYSHSEYSWEKWPVIYDSFIARVYNTANKKELLGKTLFTNVENNLFVASIFGQYYYGRQAKFTNYTALFKGLNFVAEISAADKTTMYIPKGLGCGLAGGNWDFVEAYIQDLDLFFDKKINIIIVEKE